jgi:hypothetical protein
MGIPRRRAVVKEISVVQQLVRLISRFAAASGVIAVLIWLTWVMLDIKHLQSGFTLP